jgi:hypothetical protein
MPRPTTLLAAALLTSAGTACSDSQTSSPDDATVLEEVTPAAGVPNVDPAASITVRFNHAAGSGMEQYVDLHRGGINGPVVGIRCEQFDGRRSMVCTPEQPLQSATTYTIHVGAGMVDDDGRLIEVEERGAGMGGEPVTGRMMGGMHGGESTDMMGPGWGHPEDGHLGMAFTFETA